jgi:serine/threonine protein kinase
VSTEVGRYIVYDKIASGGVADVFMARLPLGTSAFCALKMLRVEHADSEEQRAMFADEAELLTALSHPATVQVYEVGTAPSGLQFIAMELLCGQSLRALWEVHRQRAQRVPCDLIAWIGARVCEALEHAHGVRDPATGRLENVVHRDVNPSNVLVTFDGRIKLIDFGMAKREGQAIKTAKGMVKGKVGYLSPEQLEGRPADARADVFSLAVTLWELSADRRLFLGDTDRDTVKNVAMCSVPDPRTLQADYPDALWTVLRRGLAKDPDTRYASAAEMGRDLYAVAASMGRNVGPTMMAERMLELCVRA